MKVFLRHGCYVALVFVFTFSVKGQSAASVFELQERIIELYEETQSAIVRVKAVYEGKDGDDLPQVVIGTGFFISREGLILTNASIVDNPVRVWVEHGDIAYSTDYIAGDRASNLALLRINRLPEEFSFLHLADTSELVPIGSFLLRVSMPLEFAPSPSWGLVTGYESRIGEHFFPCLYLRSSIPAGPGDGGSAFVDLRGRLVGIQVGSLPEINASYVLPARAALRIRDDLLFSGEVQYGWMGFEVEEVVSIAEGARIRLADIFMDGPADEAGLMEGDILDSIGDYSIRSLSDLRNAMFYTRVGQLADMNVIRDGEIVKVTVRLEERPASEPLEVLEEAAPPPEPVGPIREELDAVNPES